MSILWILLPPVYSRFKDKTMKKVCVYDYGVWAGGSSGTRKRFIDTLPKYVILDLGLWPDCAKADIDACTAAGITMLAYVPGGGMRGFIWSEDDTTDKTVAGIKSLIDDAYALGFNGIFFDEGGLYTPVSGQSYQDTYFSTTLAAPGKGAGSSPILSVVGNSKYNADTADDWAGKYCTEYINYAKAKGMFVCVGCPMDGLSDSGFNARIATNVFSVVDAVLTSEEYITRYNADGGILHGREQTYPSQCWVLSYAGSYNASVTNNAISKGFGAAYCCASMASMTGYEAYMASITDSDPEPPTPPASTYESYWAGGDWRYDVYGSLWRGQTYTPAASKTVNGFNLSLKRAGTIGTATLALRATDSQGRPTGTNLASGTANCSGVSTSAYEKITFNFASGYNVKAGTKYALVLSLPSGDASNNLLWQADTDSSGGGYANGDACDSTDGGANWELQPSDEMYFEEFGSGSDDTSIPKTTFTVNMSSPRSITTTMIPKTTFNTVTYTPNQPPVDNYAPVMDPVTRKTVVAGSKLTFTISGTDPCGGGPLVYSSSTLPTGASFNTTTHVFKWIPNTRQVGTYYITFTLSDGSLTTSQSVMITVTRKARR
jgi:hypothetical protein